MGWVSRVMGLLALGALAGCAGSGTLGSGAGAASSHGSLASMNVLVLRAPQLKLQQGGTVLDAMRASLPQVRIEGNGSSCPALAIRGPDTLPGVTEPGVYVDGTAMTNTCILDQLGADDVSRVEVYPLGITLRPGYAPNAHGLILVFTKRAADDQ